MGFRQNGAQEPPKTSPITVTTPLTTLPTAENQKINPGVTSLYHINRVCLKVLRTSVVSMASNHISKETNTQDHPGNTKG